MFVRDSGAGNGCVNFMDAWKMRSFRVPQKECGKRSSITFFRFRDAFGHFSVTFSDASVTFFVTFFAELLLPDSFCGKVILSAGKTHVHKIPRFRRGGYFGFWGGGGVPILFLWARGFF